MAFSQRLKCHFTGPKKVSNSRAQPHPTCHRNVLARIKGLITSVNETSNNLLPVTTILEINTKLQDISTNFQKNLKCPQWGTQVPWGNWFIKKKPKVKNHGLPLSLSASQGLSLAQFCLIWLGLTLSRNVSNPLLENRSDLRFFSVSQYLSGLPGFKYHWPQKKNYLFGALSSKCT